MSKLSVTIEHKNPTTTIAFVQGSADIASTDQLKADLAKTLGEGGGTIVLDLRKLDFLTSLAVGEFIALAKAKKAQGGKVVIAGPSTYVQGVFDKARLSTVIPIYHTVDEALMSGRISM